MRATVAIVGYPRVMPDVGDPACDPAMSILMGDVPYVTAWEEALNADPVHPNAAGEAAMATMATQTLRQLGITDRGCDATSR